MTPARALRTVVGTTAILAPALHSATDLWEWLQQGFSAPLLWANYLAFLPMAWLLLGIHAAQAPKPGRASLAGAILYGAAFTYFAHTTLYALAEGMRDYATLWARLGVTYTVHGALMIAGGLLFAAGAWRARQLPRLATALFATGLLLNLVLALLPVPDLAQIAGSAVRNAGLMGMGYSLLVRPTGDVP